jgi:hypothetical protein
MYFSYKGFLFKELSFELLFIPSPTKLRRDIVTVSVILRTKYVPSFVKNPLKDVDSSVHKDVMR